MEAVTGDSRLESLGAELNFRYRISIGLEVVILLVLLYIVLETMAYGGHWR